MDQAKLGQPGGPDCKVQWLLQKAGVGQVPREGNLELFLGLWAIH